MPPWGAGPKPKKTPANTVKNSTYSTGNRFSGPPGTTTPGGPPGSGRASQISRPALAAAAATNRPNTPKPAQIGPGGAQLRVDRLGRAQGLDSAYNPHDFGNGLQDLLYYPDFDKTTVLAEPYDPRTAKPPLQYLGTPGTVTPGGPPGTGSPSQIRRPSVPSQADLSAQRYTAAAKAYQDPTTGYAQSQVAAPSPNELAGMRYQQAAQTYTEDPGAYQQMLNAPSFGTRGAMGWQPSQQELMRAATSGAATHPAAQRVQQAAPQQAAPSFSQEELMRAATSGAATHPAAQAIQQAAPAAAAPRAVGPSPMQLAEGSQGAQEQEIYKWLGTEGAQNLLASNAAAAAPAAAAPAWDPANNDPAITGPVGMWTDPTNGGQMPDPADADAWERMQRVADSEFGPGQDIYNPTYDTERFPTYDPSNTGGGWGGPDTGGTWDDGYGGVGDGPGADMGTFNPNSGEYLQFGLNLAQNTSDYNRVGEGRELWNQAQDRKWDEMRRGIPGQYNSRGMIDSGLLTRAEGLAAGDQRFETDVRQWSDNGLIV